MARDIGSIPIQQQNNLSNTYLLSRYFYKTHHGRSVVIGPQINNVLEQGSKPSWDFCGGFYKGIKEIMTYVELVEMYDWYPYERPDWMTPEDLKQGVDSKRFKEIPIELRNKLKAAWDELRRITDEIDAYAE